MIDDSYHRLSQHQSARELVMNGRKANTMPPLFPFHPVLVITLSILISGCFSHQQTLPRVIFTSPPISLLTDHFTGGFGINQPSEAADAASDGLQVDFHYNLPPDPGSSLGQALTTNNMKVVDSELWTLLSSSQCFSAEVPGPCLDTLLARVKQHLLDVKDNPLVVGYWLLDDYQGDFKTVLPYITRLVHTMTPNRPTICGFGGEFKPDGTYDWHDWIADNFTPQGCDMVAPYLYAAAQQTRTRCNDLTLPPDVQGPDAFDWTMGKMLPAVLNSLKKRGWDITKEPLIGISYAWAGCRKDLHNTFYQVIPTAADMETQALSFCQAGAMGVIWYGWEDSAVNVFPEKNSQMREGVQRGVKACRAYWKQHPTSSSTASS